MQHKVKVPKLERHPKKNLAFVRLPMPSGKRQYVYLGQYGSKEAAKEYDRVIGCWLKGEMVEAPPAPQAVPSMLVHSGTGQLYCNIPDYGEIYFGRADQPESEREYQRFIVEYLANNRVVPPQWSRVSADERTVNMAILEYYEAVKARYAGVETRYGKKPSEPTTIRAALRCVEEAYGDTPIIRFGGVQMGGVQQVMIRKKWCRSYINAQMSRLKTFFKACSVKNYITAENWMAIQNFPSLAPTRGVPEGTEVQAADDKDLQLTVKNVGRIIGTMALVQRKTGMRACEMVIMRGGRINRAKDPWVYIPDYHKTEHHGKEHVRVIYLNKEVQELLKPFIEGRDPDDYLFKPEEAVREYREQKKEERKTKVQPSQVKRAEEAALRPREYLPHYTVDGYRQALKRAIKRANRKASKGEKVQDWSPHQLRHAKAVEVQEMFDLDTVQAVLGQSDPQTARRYAKLALKKAERAALLESQQVPPTALAG